MKKIVLGLMAAGLTMSTAAFAAGTYVKSGSQITPSGGTYECKLLSESVRVNFSNSVLGAFKCDVDTNTVTVATCHEAGSRSTSLTCVQIGTDDSGEALWNDEECKDEDKTVVEKPSALFKAFAAQTSGGSVGAVQIPSGACDETNLAGLWVFD